MENKRKSRSFWRKSTHVFVHKKFFKREFTYGTYSWPWLITTPKFLFCTPLRIFDAISHLPPYCECFSVLNSTFESSSGIYSLLLLLSLSNGRQQIHSWAFVLSISQRNKKHISAMNDRLREFSKCSSWSGYISKKKSQRERERKKNIENSTQLF